MYKICSKNKRCDGHRKHILKNIEASRVHYGWNSYSGSAAILWIYSIRYDLVRLLLEVLKYSERNGMNDIGANMWGKGRTQEIGQRVMHL